MSFAHTEHWTCKLNAALWSVLSGAQDEVKEEKPFTGAEELFGASSESDTSTFHGFEEDELEESLSNIGQASPKGR